MNATDSATVRRGFLAALGAYCLWGALPLFYKWFGDVPAQEILAHRVLWSFVITGAAIALMGRGGQVWTILASRRGRRAFAASGLAIAINWGVYIWSVANARIVEASMGYYIQPLVSVVLGALVLRESLSRRQGVAVALVILGVAVMVAAEGRLPWIALVLAASFGAYGLLRKVAPAESLVGLFIETMLVTPLALGYLAFITSEGSSHFTDSVPMATMLLLTGPATAVPLLLFAFGARRLRLATVGLMMYLNPTLQMLIAVLVFGEAFTGAHAATFACIWAGILVYSIDPRALARRLAGAGGKGPARPR